MVQGEELGALFFQVRSLAGLTTWDRNLLLTENAFEEQALAVRIGGDTN
jgi:hypothetical protein